MRRGRSEADVACIRDGLKDALGKGTLAVLGFRDFVRMFSWFTSTLNMMATQEQDSAVDMARLASISSLHSEASGVPHRLPVVIDLVIPSRHEGPSVFLKIFFRHVRNAELWVYRVEGFHNIFLWIRVAYNNSSCV